jgi:hypothetical protein
MLLQAVNEAVSAQSVVAARTMAQAAAAPAEPTITILSAATGTVLRSLAAANALLDFGSVAYFKGTLVPGASVSKSSTAFVISTRFSLQVACPGSSPLSTVNLTVSSLDAASAYAIAIDGITLGNMPRTLAPSMACGSGGEHHVDLSIPMSVPAGSIASNVAFMATINK